MRTRRSRLTAAVAAVSAGLLLAACGASGGSAGGSGGGTSRIKVGYPSDTASYGDLYVCQDAGIFAKHGLQVDLTLLKTSSQLLAAVTSGSVQIAGGDGNAVADGEAKGANLKVVELKLPVYFVELWGRPDVKSPADLAGKSIGVTAPGSVTDTAVRTLLAQQGLTDKVQVKNLTSLPALLAAGQKGAVDALATAPPQGKETEAFGWHKITDTTNIKTPASLYTVSANYAGKNSATVQKFVDADVECLNYLQQNRDKSIDAIAAHTKTNDRALAAYAYDFFKKIWATNPTVDPQLIQQSLDQASKSGDTPKATDLVDNSYVQKASTTK